MRDNKRINNKGMSLVELLIAITILAIITVPLLHAFVSSARVNRKAKVTQKLTTMGQDIMEGLKAYSVEELAYEFDYPVKDSCIAHPAGFQLVNPQMLDSSNSHVMELIKSGAKFEKTDDTTQSIKENIISSTETEYKFDVEKYKDHNPYYFAMTNVSSEKASSGSYKADILITVNPKKYTTVTPTSEISNDTARHNDKMLADLYSMDTSRDAFFIESGDQVNSALAELKGISGVFPNPATANAGQLRRIIDVLVKPDPTDLTRTLVQYTFKYMYFTDDGSNPARVAEYPKNVALSILRYNELENVYLFYMPSYNTGLGDVITYENQTGKEVTFTLVKRQITEDDGLEPEYYIEDTDLLRTNEQLYKCKVKINDLNNKTIFRTNVDSDLSKLKNIADADDILKSSLSTANVQFTYNLGPGATGVRNSVAVEKYEDRIFDVKIDIYEPGTIDDAVAPGGTGQFPEDKHLVTLNGNMN